MSGHRPRIAVLADWWWPEAVGGAERSARAAAFSLARDNEVAVFVPANVERSYQDGPLAVHAVRRPFARRTHGDGTVRHGLEFLTAWLLPPVAWRLARRIRAFAPDAVVATNVARTGPWLIRRTRAGFVRVYHDLSDTCWRRSRLKGAQNCRTICVECRFKVGIMRRATPPAAVGVCVSGFVLDELTAAGLTTPDTSLVGYPLVGATPASPPPPVPAGDPVIGYLGRVDPVKGIDSAIRTVAAYRRQTGAAVSMVVAGEGAAAYVRKLASLAAAESIDVDFTGHLDVDAFCARVHAVVIPSAWWEPFGRVAVEVGGRGRPMLLARSGGLPEAAALSGGRYAFADFGDPAAAAHALADLLAPAGTADPALGAPAPATLERAVMSAVRRVLTTRPGALPARPR